MGILDGMAGVFAAAGAATGMAHAADTIYANQAKDERDVNQAAIGLENAKSLDDYSQAKTAEAATKTKAAYNGLLNSQWIDNANAATDYTDPKDPSGKTLSPVKSVAEIPNEDLAGTEPSQRQKTRAMLDAGLQTGQISAKDYAIISNKADTADALANLSAQKLDVQQQRADTYQQYADQERTARPTLGQLAKNKEIDAARKILSGMTPDQIKVKTSKFTASGRTNPEFDPALSNRLRLAQLRKFGDDSDFDTQIEGNDTQSDGVDNSLGNRFQADSAMAGMRLGRSTPNGTEVFDKSGRLAGYYK